MTKLADNDARLVALTSLDRSYLVEAGAGSGKTSLLAGRVVGLLVNGVKPAHIVSVSFTELAASELMGRIFAFAQGLVEGRIPVDIRQAYPNGLDSVQIENLKEAIKTIGDMTCTTIHGFCQKLLRPYPVEAHIDPGASILDPVDAELIFGDVLEKWLRERLSGHDMEENILTAMVAHDPAQAVSAIKSMAYRLKGNPSLTTPSAVFGRETAAPLVEAVKALRAWTAVQAAVPEEHAAMTEAWVRTAGEIESIAVAKPHVAVVNICAAEANAGIALKSGGFKKYRLKTAWKAIDKANAERLFAEGEEKYQACCREFDVLKEKAAAAGLCDLESNVRQVLTQYNEYKQKSALLDFDDLLYKTQSLLRNRGEVLAALRNYYTHILVDEFQDTDPVQSDIFTMLAFDEVEDKIVPRPGAIFFVGDPKQSIYRFRGADVGSYVRMRELMREADPTSVISIFVNFRSTDGIISFVNQVFQDPLSDPRQPGFTSLASNRGAGTGPAVLKYETLADSAVDERRKQEGDIIADAVFDLLSNYRIPEKNGETRPCRPGDIALLAPVNTNLFWLENALEDRGIPVSSQAGKGLFQQQEVKDLIALTRVLADHRDTLALGALLRGSFFGFTDTELLDASANLPQPEDGKLTFLSLATPPADIDNELLSRIVGKLAQLRANAVHTTPYDVLTHAIEVFDIRAKTRNKDYSNASRRLANVERYLDLSRSFDVRGIRAFSDTMRERWENGDRTQEGKPGGQEDAVSIITIHSSKGLEWPVVFTVNCSTEFNNRQDVFSDIRNSVFSMKFMRQKPEGFDTLVSECREEDMAERLRLVYVGLTRARDLLVVSDTPCKPEKKAWSDLVDVGLDALSYIAAPPFAAPIYVALENGPTVDRKVYMEIIEGIEKNTSVVRKVVPSSHEYHAGISDRLAFDDIIEAVPDTNPYANIEGGVHRGNILHKLMEEVVNGETLPAEVEERARELIRQVSTDEKAPELHSAEIAACIERTLELPQIVAILPRMVTEVGMSLSHRDGNVETLTLGVADAVVPGEGNIEIVIDWKGDLRPTEQVIAMYEKQVRKYMEMNGVPLGMIVFMSIGRIVEVRPK